MPSPARGSFEDAALFDPVPGAAAAAAPRSAVLPTRRRSVPAASTLLVLAIFAGLAPAGPARAADPVSYATTLKPTGNGALDAALRSSSSLVALQKTRAVGPFALAGRARADIARLRTALESFGFYAGSVSITVAGHPVSDPALPDVLQALPAGRTAPITVAVTEGPLFRLGTVSLRLPPGERLDPAAQAAFGLHEGQPAVASDVLAAQNRLQTTLEEQGHAFAAVQAPTAYLRPDSRTLDIVFVAKEGPRVDIGPITLAGLRRVNGRYVARRLEVRPGELYRPSRIEAARQDLAATGVFASVGVKADAAPDADGTLPIRFDFTEARLRTVALQAGYSTDLGGSAGVTWTHHDLFGNAEKLDLVALLTGLGGTSVQGLGYDVYADLLKPDFRRRDQSLDLRVEGLKQDLESYNQTALLVRGTIQRKLSRFWSVSAGLGAEQERIIQEGDARSYTLAFLPITANYDGTGLANPLDSATHGVRASLGATPTYSFGSGGQGGGQGGSQGGSQGGGGNTVFTILQATVSTYLDLHRIGLAAPGRSVVAVRGTVGSVQGASTFALPPDQRLYAGGSSTVRGYKYQGVGPLFADGYATGGTAVDAGTVEFRQRIGKSFGVAAFADAGQVGTTGAPFMGTLRVGAGIGARYYTAIGPIRLDVAVPLDKPQGGDSFELYVGLGEAF